MMPYGRHFIGTLRLSLCGLDWDVPSYIRTECLSISQYAYYWKQASLRPPTAPSISHIRWTGSTGYPKCNGTPRYIMLNRLIYLYYTCTKLIIIFVIICMRGKYISPHFEKEVKEASLTVLISTTILWHIVASTF